MLHHRTTDHVQRAAHIAERIADKEAREIGNYGRWCRTAIVALDEVLGEFETFQNYPLSCERRPA